MRIVVAIASLGRAETLKKVVDRLGDQTRQPDDLILSVTGSQDVVGLEYMRLMPHVIFAPKGLCIQRNAVLNIISGKADVVVFFDDDFVPANDYLEQVEKIFEESPDIVGITGDLVDDGIHGEPIGFDDAVRRLDVVKARPETDERRRLSLYGCNMAMRLEAAEGMRFDEKLPFYAWQEDVDFTFRLGQHGLMISGPQVTGIHMGVRGARQPGKKLGYSQIANIVYLSRKRTMPPGLGPRLVLQNFASNLVRSIWPEQGIDRRGRLWGNLIAFGDWARGRIDPMRITKF